jgi:hypothetical protein
MWESPANGADLPWNTPYSVTGRISNLAQAVADVVVLDVRQQDGSSSNTLPDKIVGFTPLPTGLSPNETREITWDFKQDWTWLDKKLWFTVGPTSRAFTYTVSFQFKDSYGNSSNLVITPGPTVKISVSASKLAYATSANLVAMEASVFAAAAAILLLAGNPIAAGICAGIAATLWKSANKLGEQALDPPVPNFGYRANREVPMVEPLKLSDSAPRELLPLISYTELVHIIASGAELLADVKSRVLATRIDLNAQAMAREQRVLDNLTGQILSASAALIPTAAEVVSSAAIKSLLSKEQLFDFLQGLEDGRLPAEFRQHWRTAGYAEEDLEAIEYALTHFEPDKLTAVHPTAFMLGARSIVNAVSLSTADRV